MAEELARRNLADLDDHGETAMLVSLLSLVSDAVLLFDETGTIRLANEAATALFRQPEGGLVDVDVRWLFLPPATVRTSHGPVSESLPFALDGSSTTVVCEARSHQHVSVRVRCERLCVPAEVYVLVAHQSDALAQIDEEHAALVGELSRANRRLSGTLKIVLQTLDSLDIGTLFARILEEMTETMDAWASTAYVGEHDGFRLSNATSALDFEKLPALLSFQHPLVALLASEGRTLRFAVRPPTREQLRDGDLSTKEVVDEETGTVWRVSASSLPPFTSFALVPIWFGGSMISVLQVGWRHMQHIGKDDARLLDSVAEYLSVQLAGAFAAMRAQHVDRLESLGTQLRERLLSGEQLTPALLLSVFEQAAEGLGTTCVPLEGNIHQPTTVAELPHVGMRSIPVDLAALSREYDTPFVLPLDELPELEKWLTANGQMCNGAIAVIGVLEDATRGFLLLRPYDEEPLEEADLTFLRRLADDVVEIRAGEDARRIDKRIAEALQRGMRNELQRVDGLSTQSLYSSATKAALVGGDFFDLVRLPQRRACVIMGDVSGKGVEAASVSSAVKTALGAYAWEGLRPSRMVSLLNDFLLGFSRLETFATLFVGIIDLQESCLRYCSAGHPPALLVRSDTGELVTLGVQSGVVGAFETMRYHDGEVDIRSGDVLLLYTDGVTEARNPQGVFFAEEGLRDAVSREAAKGFEGLCDRLLDAVSSFTGESLSDDVALVAVRVD